MVYTGLKNLCINFEHSANSTPKDTIISHKIMMSFLLVSLDKDLFSMLNDLILNCITALAKRNFEQIFSCIFLCLVIDECWTLNVLGFQQINRMQWQQNYSGQYHLSQATRSSKIINKWYMINLFTAQN